MKPRQSLLESREAKNPRLSSGNEAGLDKRKGLIESILLAAAASVFFIAWGVYANWEHGLGAIDRLPARELTS